MIKTGGCLCGETRYQITAEPFRSSVCHCRYCQLRTGSAFGVSIYFRDEEVILLSGKLDHFSYATESGHNVKNERCSICGTNLFWTIDAPSYIDLKALLAEPSTPQLSGSNWQGRFFLVQKLIFVKSLLPKNMRSIQIMPHLNKTKKNYPVKKTMTLPTHKGEY